MKRLILILCILGVLAVPSLSSAGLFRRNSCYVSSGYSYSYPSYSYIYATPYVAPTYTAPAYVAPAVVAPVYGDNWKTEAFKYAEKLDDIRLFERTMQGLGVYQNGYQHYASSYGASGATQYGYNYQQIAQAYGTTDLNVLYQQAARLAQDAQGLGGQATADFSGLVGQAGQNQARVAEILAKAQSASMTLRAAEATPSTSVTTTIQGGQTVQGNGIAPAPLNTNDPKVGAWLTSAKARCFACHSGGTIKGGLDLTGFPGFSRAKQLDVISRIFTADPQRRMPRKADGTAGEQLPIQESQAWLGVVN